LSSAFTNFRDKLLKYEPEEFVHEEKLKFLNRSPPFQNKDQKYITKNISNVKNLSQLNKLRAMSDGRMSVNKNSKITNPSYFLPGSGTVFNNTRKDMGLGVTNPNYVFFTRKSKSRRFNEQKYSETPKRINIIDNLKNQNHKMRIANRVAKSTARSYSRDQLSEISRSDILSKLSRQFSKGSPEEDYNSEILISK